MARQSDPSTFLQITIFLPIPLSPPFLPAPQAHHITAKPKTCQPAQEMSGQLLLASSSLSGVPSPPHPTGNVVLLQPSHQSRLESRQAWPPRSNPTHRLQRDRRNSGHAPCHDWGAATSLSCCQPAGSKQCHTELSSGQGRVKSLFIELFLLWNFHWPVKYFYIYYTFNGSS